jgi:hypothetical protein
MTITKVPKMNSLKALVGQRMTKKVKFMGQDVEIAKLSAKQVLEIQAKAQELEKKADEAEGFELLMSIVRASVADAAELTDADFLDFPTDELSNLSSSIMTFSGMKGDQGK